jgi:predicted nucleotide-binding protein
MKASDELFKFAKILQNAADVGDEENIVDPLELLEKVVKQIGRSFSGSWLGYHSRVYYDGFSAVPPGANFSQEWGLKGLHSSSLGSRGAWREYDPDYVKACIYETANNPDLQFARDAAQRAETFFDGAKAEILSIFENETADSPDPFLTKLGTDLEKLEPMSKVQVERHLSPKGQVMTRDTTALGQGIIVPPHAEVAAEIIAIQHSFSICKTAAGIAQKAASHLERKNRRKAAADRVGTNVFIGHGRSGAWRELKDFVQDRLQLPWDEFNRVPVAGVTNITRLSEMLEAAAVAFLVMTAEDEMIDGALQARMNVVHEAGLFQGRLGFNKAIVLLEDGCSEFSNINGLGQIRFPKNNIAAAFEEIRRVLEREGLFESADAQKN